MHLFFPPFGSVSCFILVSSSTSCFRSLPALVCFPSPPRCVFRLCAPPSSVPVNLCISHPNLVSQILSGSINYLSLCIEYFKYLSWNKVPWDTLKGPRVRLSTMSLYFPICSLLTTTEFKLSDSPKTMERKLATGLWFTCITFQLNSLHVKTYGLVPYSLIQLVLQVGFCDVNQTSLPLKLWRRHHYNVSNFAFTNKLLFLYIICSTSFEEVAAFLLLLDLKKKPILFIFFPLPKQPFPEKNPISVLSHRSTNGIIELDLTLQACIHMRQLRSGHCYHKWAVKIITDVEPADSLSNKVSQTRK